MSAYILDVGHGNCAVIRDDTYTVVVDAGPGTSLLEFLKKEEISSIDALLISHADKDHISGLIGILSSGEFAIRKIRLNTDSKKDSVIWDDLMYTLSKSQCSGEIDFDVSLTANKFDTFNYGSIKIEILAPSTYLAGKGPGSKDRAGRTITSNSISAVIRVSENDIPILVFTGDIDNTGLLNMIEYIVGYDVDASAPVVVFPHHGGRVGVSDIEDFTQRVYECLKPTTIIFSIGRGRYSTPQPIVIKTIKDISPETRIVCTQLSEHCASVLPTVAAEHLADKFAAGRNGNACCAGTIVVRLNGNTVSVTPGDVMHEEFVLSVAPTALCRRC